MKIILFILLLTSVLLAREYPKSYGTCIGCHGLKGERNSQVPESRPNSLSRTSIIKALKAYRNNSRDIYNKAKLMYPFAKHLSDREIVTIARYLTKR